ncbi:papain-like cysteine protease family protein [Ralstonia pseudosolanacearum]
MSVLTGVDHHTGHVIFHDPQQGPDLTMPLSYFNQRLAWQVPHAMLHR